MLQQVGQEEKQVSQQAQTSDRHQNSGPEIKICFPIANKKKNVADLL